MVLMRAGLNLLSPHSQPLATKRVESAKPAEIWRTQLAVPIGGGISERPCLTPCLIPRISNRVVPGDCTQRTESLLANDGVLR